MEWLKSRLHWAHLMWLPTLQHSSWWCECEQREGSGEAFWGVPSKSPWNCLVHKHLYTHWRRVCVLITLTFIISLLVPALVQVCVYISGPRVNTRTWPSPGSGKGSAEWNVFHHETKNSKITRTRSWCFMFHVRYTKYNIFWLLAILTHTHIHTVSSYNACTCVRAYTHTRWII